MCPPSVLLWDGQFPVVNIIRTFGRNWMDTRCYMAAHKVDPDHLNLGIRYAWIHNPVQVVGCEHFGVFDINCYDFDPVPQI